MEVLLLAVALAVRRREPEELGQDASNAPLVDLAAIVFLKDDLWCAVESGHDAGGGISGHASHILRHVPPDVVGVQVLLQKDGPRQAEIANLDPTIVVNQDISGLEISVHYVGRMQKMNSTQYVIQDGCHMLLVELHVLQLHKSSQVTVFVLQDQENRVEINVWNNDFNQLCGENIFFHLGELFQNFNFSEHQLRMVRSLKNLGNVFYGIVLVGLPMLDLVDLAITATANQVLDFIPISQYVPIARIIIHF
jgi:hypothetical protein